MKAGEASRLLPLYTADSTATPSRSTSAHSGRCSERKSLKDTGSTRIRLCTFGPSSSSCLESQGRAIKVAQLSPEKSKANAKAKEIGWIG